MSSEAEKLVGVVGHLLGLRRGRNGNLVDNESVTARQRQSGLDIENVCVNASGGSEKWEAGGLLEAVLELDIIKEQSEVSRLREKYKKNGTGTGQGNCNGVASQRAQALPVNGNVKSSFRKEGPGSFLAPRTVSTQIKTENCKRNEHFVETGAFHQAPASSGSLFSAVGKAGKANPVEKDSGYIVRASQEVRPTASLNNGVPGPEKNNPFRSAYDQLKIDDKNKGIQRSMPPPATNVHVSGLRKPIKREPPPPSNEPKEDAKPKYSDNPEVEEIMSHESMSNIDPKMVEAILNEVVQTTSTTWEDIAGLEGVKSIIREVIIWPMRRPDIFTGLRASPKGILFFGPPGTGKTMFGRVIANQFNSTFFNISASSLTSKWIGDGEKMVRALFAVARVKQPAVIFIDEIDSILTARSDTEHESSRRLKTEFLIQFDGCATQSEEKILVIGVTNRPQELDDAARRRFVKRIYIPLPDLEGRKQLVKNLLKKYSTDISEDEFDAIAKMTEGYSGADMTSLCREAAYGPIREVCHMLDSIEASEVRPMQMKDFVSAQRQVKSSVASSDVVFYEDWDSKFGCHI